MAHYTVCGVPAFDCSAGAKTPKTAGLEWIVCRYLPAVCDWQLDHEFNR